MMTLPTPRLDDRTFQQLVDEAKRQVQQRCPAWTDHNVSDPGVTLIETFAWMTEMLLYRLNRVPDQLYVRFLEMVGVRLFPPQAAHAEMSRFGSRPINQYPCEYRPERSLRPGGPSRKGHQLHHSSRSGY